MKPVVSLNETDGFNKGNKSETNGFVVITTFETFFLSACFRFSISFIQALAEDELRNKIEVKRKPLQLFHRRGDTPPSRVGLGVNKKMKNEDYSLV